MKEAILILRELNEGENAAVLKRARDENIPVFTNTSITDALRETARKVELSPEEKRKINYDIRDQLLAFGDKEVEGVPINRHLALDKWASIWYYHKFRMYFILRNKHYDITQIDLLAEDFDHLEVYTNYNLDLYFDENIRFYLPSANLEKDYLSMFKYALFFMLKVFLGFFSKTGPKQKYLLLDSGELQPVIMPDLSVSPGNYNLEYLFLKLNEEFVISHVLDVPKFNKQKRFNILIHLRRNRKRLTKSLSGEYVLFRALLVKRIRTQLKYYSQMLLKEYQLIESMAETVVEKDIVRELWKLHKTSKYFIFRYLSFSRYFHHHPYTSIACIDENSPALKTILDAAKSQNINTIGIQHGNIFDLLMSYSYTKTDADFGAMTDRTLVWGNYFKKLLIGKSNYPEHGVITVGQARTDIIPSLKSMMHSGIVKDVDSSRKIIVFASQPQPDEQLRWQSAFDVFCSVKHRDDVQLVVKLHPSEKNDFEYYNNIAKKAGSNNYKILLDVDLYALLSVSSIVITCYSTVGSEAIYFNKPLIIIDYQKQDLLKYIQLGVAHPAYRLEDLTSTIENILSGKTNLNSEAYSHFIDLYAYRIDGKVADRILKAIKEVNN